MAHARRKFYDLHVAIKSTLTAEALPLICQLYGAERERATLNAEDCQRRRQEHTDTLYRWMLAQRQRVPDGSATAKALDYSLKRWTALTHYLNDGVVPIDNNWVENQIRPWALASAQWLFAGSLLSCQRAAAVMTLIQSARLTGHDPYAYLKDVLAPLPTQRASAIDELLPHNWKSVITDKG